MTRKTKNKRDDVPIPGPSLSFNNNSHDGENYLVDEEEATSALLRQMEVEGWGCRRSNRLAPAAPTISNTHPAAVESQDTPTTSSNNLPPNPQQKSQKKAAISRGKSTIVEKQVERQVDKDKDSKKRPRPSYKKPRENGGDSDNDSSSSENDSESGDDFRDEEYTIEEEKSDDEDDYTPLGFNFHELFLMLQNSKMSFKNLF